MPLQANYSLLLTSSALCLKALSYSITAIGRIIAIIAIFVMFSGIGDVVAVLGTLSQRRLQRAESRFKSKTEVQPRLVAVFIRSGIMDKIEGMEKLTQEDFDTLVIMMKNLYRTLLEESKIIQVLPISLQEIKMTNQVLTLKRHFFVDINQWYYDYNLVVNILHFSCMDSFFS